MGDAESGRRETGDVEPSEDSLHEMSLPRVYAFLPSPVSRFPLPASRQFLHSHRLESIAPADRGDLQVQRCVPRVTTVIEQLLRSLGPSANGGDLVGLGMRLAEMGAQPALPVVKLLHVSPPFEGLGRRTPQVPRSRIEHPVESGRTGRATNCRGFSLLPVSRLPSPVSSLPLPASRFPLPCRSLLRWYSPVAPV